jgi:hypothetical protein
MVVFRLRERMLPRLPEIGSFMKLKNLTQGLEGFCR